MKINGIGKRLSAIVLGAALAVSFAFTGNTAMVHAASLNLISKQTSSDGYNTKYYYNKNGLLSKSVANYTEKYNAEYNSDLSMSNVARDEAITETTTYKYNKNNKIARKTEKIVTATTYLQMDEATRMKVLANLGTITTTKTIVTDYTYNKKGLATKSIDTLTIVKSGSISGTTGTSFTQAAGWKELSDGRVIAGYNEYDENGNPVSEDTIANAYFLSNPSELEPVVITTTCTYKDNGDGTYSYEKAELTTQNGCKIVQEKKSAGDHEIITSVKAVQDPQNNATHSRVTTNDYLKKTILVTDYSYDSKNRVKKASATAKEINNRDYTRVVTDSVNTVNNTYTETGTKSYTLKAKDSSDEEGASTTTYTYDKNGHCTKSIMASDGVVNRREMDTLYSFRVLETSDLVRTYNDGRPSENIKTEKTSDKYYYQTTTSVGGVTTSTMTYNPYTVTETVNGNTTTTSYHWDAQKGGYVAGTGETYTTEPTTEPDIATPFTVTSKYSFDKKGNLKTAKTSEETTTIENVTNPVYGNIIYEVNEKGRVVEKMERKTTKHTETENYENTVKNNNLIEVYAKHREVDNRTEKSSYSVKHKKYTFKRVNAKADKIARKQQWIIQNDTLNGEIGLY